MNPRPSTILNLPDTLVLPLEFHDNIPFMRGELDGKPCLLLLDSGAPDITLNAARIPADNLFPGGELLGASGTVKSYRTRFQELRFGPWCMGPMEVMAMDESILEDAFGLEFVGLIGFRQLVHYDWMVDFSAKELHLWSSFRKDKHPVEAEMRVRYSNHLPVMNVEIGGSEFQLLLDTGASGIVFDREKQSLLDDLVVAKAMDELQGAGGRRVSVSSGRLTRFRAGPREFADSEIKFADVSALQERIGPFDGIMGYPILGKARIVVSWEQKRLFFLED